MKVGEQQWHLLYLFSCVQANLPAALSVGWSISWLVDWSVHLSVHLLVHPLVRPLVRWPVGRWLQGARNLWQSAISGYLGGIFGRFGVLWGSPRVRDGSCANPGGWQVRTNLKELNLMILRRLFPTFPAEKMAEPIWSSCLHYWQFWGDGWVVRHPKKIMWYDKWERLNIWWF